ncbi:MAG: hypothetical protein GY913_08325 [Proteobacteria bacterium]|nr:hypothetical protein [Pseudomonadota bacterium]MCP4916915.1 hypothetical protein [Pseudomonadota bacterium]
MTDYLEISSPAFVYGPVEESLRRDLSEAGVAAFVTDPVRAVQDALRAERLAA